LNFLTIFGFATIYGTFGSDHFLYLIGNPPVYTRVPTPVAV
jgi:hypothetical protein